MAKVGVKFKVKGSITKELTNLLSSLFGKTARQNFGDFRPFIEEAIDEGVINTRQEFIPDDGEAAELGVGANGAIDRSRTQGAWSQLLVSSSTRAVTFSVRKDTRKNKIGNIVVSIDENTFYEGSLSNVDTPDSEEIDSIPWMRWLVEGAPAGAVLPDHVFTEDVPQFSASRTGAGRMIRVEGGIWSFPPARLGAFKLLTNEIERQIEIAIRRDIGKVL
jgi:hypothetical protein